jgi:tetratricopeptide (TPR) repeat protein
VEEETPKEDTFGIPQDFNTPITQPPTTEEVPTTQEPESQTTEEEEVTEEQGESGVPESDRMEGITSVFTESGFETSQETAREETPLVEEIASELTEKLESEETPPTEIESPPESKGEATEEEVAEESSVVKEPPVTEETPKEKPTATETLAEIYLKQGFTEEALNIYKELLSQDPENEVLKSKIAELENPLPSTQKQPPEEQPKEESTDEPTHEEPTEEDKRNQAKNLDNFQDWLKKFQK